MPRAASAGRNSPFLSNGATAVMYEGTPTHPGPDRWWSLIEKWGVTIFYTAPTAIRTFIRLGDEHPVERIAVMHRQRNQGGAVAGLDGKDRKIIVVDRMLDEFVEGFVQ